MKDGFKILLIFIFSSSLATKIVLAENIKIGALFPQTGFAASAGRAELDGVRMAVDDVNSKGGIGGKQIELVIEDNASSMNSTITALKKLISIEKVNYFIGPSWAEFSEVAAPVAEGNKVVMITPSGYTEKLFEGRSFVFSLWADTDFQVRPFAEYISRQGLKRIVVVHTINAYFDGIAGSLVKQLKSLGITPAEVVAVNPEERDFKSLITRFKQNGSDGIVFLLLESGENAIFVRQVREMNYLGKLYAGMGLEFDILLSNEPILASGIPYMHYNIVAEDSFQTRFKAFSREEPYASIGRAYDAVMLLKWSIEKCGAESEKVRECLHKIDYQGVSGRIKFDARGAVIPDREVSSVYEVRDGKYIPIK